ncbi:MAG: hypothetical protein JSR73_13160 [Proteobacteria bacterium]|nr:hypothetical protein [Pseudomonadota bacterium]
MQSLVGVLWDIALWRRGPGALPASGPLLARAACAYAASSALEAWLVNGPPLAVLSGFVDLAFTTVVFWLCLAVGRRPHRLQQTLLAVFGTGTLLMLASAAVIACADALGRDGDAGKLVANLSLPLVLWGVAVLAHIVREALDQPLVTGVAVATSYVVLGTLLIEELLPRLAG